MPLKIEPIRIGRGFGDGLRNDEYYFSQGITHKRRGIEPGWAITKSIQTSELAALGLINWFVERSSNIYGVNSSGEIFSVVDGADNWASVHDPATVSNGNGLIVDQKNRLLYPQVRYLGIYGYAGGTAWTDDWKDFGDDLSPTSAPCPSDLYEDWVAFGHNNKVALLNVTDDSWNASAFTLPDEFKIRDLKAGKNGVLIGANFGERGILILWDCQSDRAIVPWIWTKGKIQGIDKYKGIWVVSTGREYLITNGYSIIKSYPAIDLTSVETNFGPAYPSGMEVSEDMVYITSATGLLTRRKQGVYILDLTTGLLEFCPLSNYNTYSNSAVNALFTSSKITTYVSYKDSFPTPDQYYIGKLVPGASKSYYISPKIGRGNNKKEPEAIVFDLTYKKKSHAAFATYDWKISVKLYDFSRQLWGYAQARAAASNKDEIPVNGSISQFSVEVGDEITVLEGSNAGEIKHIKSIASEGTATEVWTLDSELSELIEENAMVNVSPFKKVGAKTITTADIKDNRLFVPIKIGMVGRKFLIKVVFDITPAYAHFGETMWFVYNELGAS